jgi:MOSC domain-containing protein YiiM
LANSANSKQTRQKHKAKCMAEMLHLHIAQVHRFPVKEVDEVLAVADKGLKNCTHGRPRSKRQVLLMDAETLDALGVVKENITTRVLDMRSVAPGKRMRIGGALVEVTIPCDPCSRMDEIRQGLQQELRGLRGWLCSVGEGGAMKRGALIVLVE